MSVARMEVTVGLHSSGHLGRLCTRRWQLSLMAQYAESGLPRSRSLL